MLAQYFAGNTLPRGTARCGVTAIGKGKGRIIALETEHFEEILGFRQLELRCDALGKCPRFQQAILRLVEFLVGNTSLALDPLKIGDLVRLARNFERRGCRLLRRPQQGREQADQETDRNRAAEPLAPAPGEPQKLA